MPLCISRCLSLSLAVCQSDSLRHSLPAATVSHQLSEALCQCYTQSTYSSKLHQELSNSDNQLRLRDALNCGTIKKRKQTGSISSKEISPSLSLQSNLREFNRSSKEYLAFSFHGFPIIYSCPSIWSIQTSGVNSRWEQRQWP